MVHLVQRRGHCRQRLAAVAGQAAGDVGGGKAGGTGGGTGGGAGGGALSYVGTGQGEYIQETTYKYVGEGAGDFEPVKIGGSNRVYVFCCGFVGILAVLLVVIVFCSVSLS